MLKILSILVIEKDNYQGEKTLMVGLITDSKPFCFVENEEIKGSEIDLLYDFANIKNIILI